MILWLLLFFLVVAISFVLAYQSMKDFEEKPVFSGYGLFLIRDFNNLNPQLLSQLHKLSEKEAHIFSIERVFKGLRCALLIFGPKDILQNFNGQLNLLELEDYTSVEAEQILAWEMGVKDKAKLVGSVFKTFPKLADNEQFWWQIILQPKKDFQPLSSKLLSFLKGGKGYDLLQKRLSTATGPKQYHFLIRNVILSADSSRRKNLAMLLQNMAPDNLIKVPKPQTSAQILEAYTKRTAPAMEFLSTEISSDKIFLLI